MIARSSTQERLADLQAEGNITSKPSIRQDRRNLGALVMGGDYRGLGLVRSLGRQGVPVWVINQTQHRLAGTSRYARRSFSHPNWQDESSVGFLLDLAQRYELSGWLLFPTADDAVRLISRHYEALSRHFCVTVPPWETLQLAVDKGRMHCLADEIGVEHPRTTYPRSREDVASIELTFPVILKPTLRDQVNSLTIAKAWRADDRSALLAKYDEARQFIPSEMLMIQEMIPGGGECQFSFAAICNEGELLASLVARRTRQYPMDFGRFSTFVETVDEPGVVGPATSFLRAIQYTGLVEVEFKMDPRTGRFKLLDINPRVWGWYSLCVRAGVNFAYLLWLLHQGKPLPRVQALQGVRWVRMDADLLVAIREILRGRLSLLNYVRTLGRPREAAIFAWDDIWPGVIELPLFAALALKRILQHRRIL